MTNEHERLRFSTLLAFFLPLSATASLVSFSHLIINSTLARTLNPEMAIAGFAIIMNLFSIIERPLLILRQTCSVLLKDRHSFRVILRVTAYVMFCSIMLTLVVGFTPLGLFVMRTFYDLKGEMLTSTMTAYRIMLFATFFSGVRSLYQGIIIANHRTKWLTIGMCIRLFVMGLLAVWFVQYGNGGAWIGATLFLAGMIIEAGIGFIEGHKIIRRTPEVNQQHEQLTMSKVFVFYRPLLYSSFLAVFIGPSINAMLGRTVDIHLAIASFAIGMNIFMLVNNFAFYAHQLALQFYETDRQRTIQFIFMMSLVPATAMGLLAYTDIGTWFLQDILGVRGQLMVESKRVLRVMMINILIFPILDFSNGLVMLFKRTKFLVWSQGGNLLTTLMILSICLLFVPDWNGIIGAIAMCSGVMGELIIVGILLYKYRRIQSEYT